MAVSSDEVPNVAGKFSEGSAIARAIVFPPFRLDLRAGELTRAGTPIPLRPKTWAVLVHLAERPGLLVTRDELFDAVWPDVAVTPDTLTKSIGELRLALGDDPAAPRFIATVHRRGFRFVAAPSGAAGEAALAPPREPVAAPSRRPFVGRDAELARLDAHLARAERGDRQLVFVAGEAGIGKSALVARWLERTVGGRRERPLWVARGGCIEQHGPREPYLPVLKALGRLARRADAAPLVAHLRRVAPTWLAQMPWLVDDPEALAALVQTANADRMLREFRALVEALTVELTLVLVLEDLHWCDAATVDLLSVLAEGGEAGRVLVIGTHRPADLVVREHPLLPAKRAMLLRQQCVELPLHALGRAEVGRYLEARFPGATVPAELAARLHAHTDGTPLFVGTLADHLVARGVVIDTAPGWAFVRSIDPVELGVPDDARLMIDVLLAGLSPADRELLSAASVVGAEFAAQHVAGALGRSVESVESACDGLAHAGRFLRFAGGGEWYDGGPALRYAFAHELYRRVVYEAVPPPSRRRLHQRIGETLEAAFGERGDHLAAELAAHFERAGDLARTVRYLGAAASSARRRFADREAAEYLGAGIAAARRLADARVAQQEELALRVALAPLLNTLAGPASESMAENGERARALCAAVGSPEQTFWVLYALAHVYIHRADPQRTAEVVGALAAAAEAVGTRDLWVLVDSVRARAAFFAARFREVVRLVDDGPLAAGEPLTLPLSLTGTDPIHATRWAYGISLWFMGELARAEQVMRPAIAAADADEVGYSRLAGLAHGALYAVLRGRADQVRRLAGEIAAKADEVGVPFLGALAEAYLAWMRVLDGDPAGAIAPLEEALRVWQARGGALLSNLIRGFLVEAHLAAGSHAAGLAVVDEGLAVAETTAERMWWPELWRLRGMLLRASPAAASEAEACFARAIELARAADMRPLELRAALALAAAWAERGRGAEAVTLLSALCAAFPDDVDDADLAAARALLGRLVAGASSRPARAGGARRRS